MRILEQSSPAEFLIAEAVLNEGDEFSEEFGIDEDEDEFVDGSL